jgi:DNA-binding IclR family transcriptional regulator
VVGPTVQLVGDDLDRYVRLVRQCALRIGRAMGYAGTGR